MSDVPPIPLCEYRWVESGGGADVAERCLGFLAQVGIAVGPLSDPRQTQLLGGLAILDGQLLVDPATPVWPGDLLHEGGHIAVCDPALRPALGPIAADGGDEMAAIAWSFATARACGVTLDQLFHEGGYRGDAAMLRENFGAGRYFGVPLLACWGMTRDPYGPASGDGPVFPAMHRWLR